MSGGALLAYGQMIDELADASGFGLAIFDAELRFVRVSQMLATLNGAPAEEHRGRSLAELVPEAIARIVGDAVQRVFATGKAVYDVELESGTGEGQRYWIDHCLPIREDDRVVAVAVVVIDRTAKRRAMAALRKSEEQFRTISETAPVGVFLTDGRGQSLYSNQVNLSQLGLSLEESLGSGWQRSIHPDDRARVREEFYAATLARRPYRAVNRYLHPDGRVVYVDVKANAFFDGDTLLGYVGVAEDITDRLAAEAALRESEMRFRQLAENVEAVFWISSADHLKLLYISPGFQRIWGRAPSSIDGLEALYATIHPADLPLLRDAIATRETFTVEYRIVRADGETRWIQDRGFPVRDDEGRVVRHAGIATDITERKLLEAQVLQSQKLDSIGRLAGGIAHDFNNLLGVIRGQVELVMRSLESLDVDDVRDRLREVELAANHAADLTRHLLTFARQQEVQLAVVDLNDVVRTIEILLRRIVGDGVELRLQLDGDLVIVKADPTQIEQIVVNLVANARAAMTRGGPLTIATRNRELQSVAAAALGVSPGVFAELAVKDTGDGIAPSDLPHIFEPFFTTRASTGGTGLGLATCYGIARKSGGTMAVESRLGEGTTFRLYLPRVTPH